MDQNIYETGLHNTVCRKSGCASGLYPRYDEGVQVDDFAWALSFEEEFARTAQLHFLLRMFVKVSLRCALGGGLNVLDLILRRECGHHRGHSIRITCSCSWQSFVTLIDDQFGVPEITNW